MKNIFKYTLALVAMTLIGVSCIQDDIDYIPIDINEVRTGQLELHFSVQDSELVTRAAQDIQYEYNVSSIYVFVFSGNQRVALAPEDIQDTNGNINYFDLEEITNEHNKTGANDSQTSHGTLTLGAVAGANMRICCIANIGASNSETRASISDNVSKEIDKFDDIKTYSDLQALVLQLGAESVFRQSAFLLTGEKTGVSLNADGSLTKVEIPLYRTDAKVTFNVTAANSNYRDFKFVPKKWRVVNVPKGTYALPRQGLDASTQISAGSNLDADNEAEMYFSTAEMSFEGSVDDAENSGTFTFYMYENLKGHKSTAQTYADRETQAKQTPGGDVALLPGQKYINGDYVNAPELGTYVVFSGQLSYAHDAVTDGGVEYDEYVMADAEYCVHLGHNSDSNYNDYKTLRNHHYTYNVQITGVNDLLVEVEGVDGSGNNKEEKRPGVEGEVVMSAAKLIEIDGHYDRALITFTPEEAATIFFAIKTPWERGLDTNGFLESEADSYVNDYKWIKFLVNSEYDISENNYAPYPGEQCYDGGKTKYGTAANSNAYGENVVLRDIRQLSNYFSENRPTGNVTVTAFIDEYLYFYDPRTDVSRVTSKDGDNSTIATTYKGIRADNITASDLLLWKRSVNGTARMMHIVKKGDMNYSEDGETSLSRSVVSIQQQPILSLYNENALTLETAWASETVNETPRMEVTRDSYRNITNTNYYTIAQTMISGGSPRWADVISATDRYGLGSSYQDPSYACATRNRDLDGDGTIDQNEVLWYLASLDQMSGLWIADPIFTNKMYDPDNPDGYYSGLSNINNGGQVPATHYATSTINNSSPMVYWAEEFGATSSHSAAIGWKQAPQYEGKYIVSLRCVRNVGKKYTDTSLPQDYYIVKPAVAGTKTDITDEVLADGIANESEYEEQGETQVGGSSTNIDDVPTNYKGPKPNDNSVSWSSGWNSSTKKNAYGRVVRNGRNNNYTYTYYNYVYYKNVGGSDASIDLTYINSGALRTAPDNGVPLAYGDVNSVTENNRPYTGFFLQEEGTSVTNWRTAYNAEIAGNSVCPGGYRMPNQREMILMTIAIDTWTPNSGAYAMFNGQYLDLNVKQFGEFYYVAPGANSSYNPDRIARVLSSVNAGSNVGAGSSNGFYNGVNNYVRCVKDNPNAKQDASSDFEEGGEM